MGSKFDTALSVVLLLIWRVFNGVCFLCEAPKCEWSGDEKKAGGAHRGPTPGPRTAPTQQLLPLLVRLLQVSLVRKYYAILYNTIIYYTVLYHHIIYYTILII